MDEILDRYLPTAAVPACHSLIREHGVHLRVVNQRVTRHGDYRRLPDGGHMITVNAGSNPYRFLITLVHEIAHLVAFEKYGRKIKPHGQEWKFTFQQLMLPFIRPEVFPSSILPVVAAHFRNPRASSSTDASLSIALRKFDAPSDKNCVYELPLGSIFAIHNGKKFRKGPRRIKRYECVELDTGRVYLFQPNAEVHFLGER